MSSELPASHNALRIIRLPQVCSVTGLRRSMIYRLEAEQRFPNRIKIGVRALGWIESEVQAWVEQRIGASRAQAVSPGENHPSTSPAPRRRLGAQRGKR